MADDSDKSGKSWQVYMLLCSDGSLYTGITKAVARRFAQHTAGTGAKFFRGRHPLRVVYLEVGHDRSSASRRELEIKKLRPAAKRALVDTHGDWEGIALSEADKL